MLLSDLSVTRPVFATVLSLLLIAFGLISYSKLALREYPDIDPPVVSVDTSYLGASANIVETRITELIEFLVLKESNILNPVQPTGDHALTLNLMLPEILKQQPMIFAIGFLV